MTSSKPQTKAGERTHGHPTVRYDEGIVANAADLSDRRLELTERLFDPHTHAVLDGLPGGWGIRSDWRCLELGAGRGSVARWLARCCPDGQVTATDVDPRLLDTEGLPNLNVLRHDAVTDDFAPGSFDLIHCRAVLANIPGREVVLAKAASWLAPGGWLVIEEPIISPLGDSPYPAFQRLLDAVEECVRAHQATDVRWGRHAAHAISQLGLTQLDMTAFCVPSGQRHLSDELWRVTAAQVASLAIQLGLITEEDLTAALTLLDDPTFVDVGLIMIAAWGRKPTPEPTT